MFEFAEFLASLHGKKTNSQQYHHVLLTHLCLSFIVDNDILDVEIDQGAAIACPKHRQR